MEMKDIKWPGWEVVGMLGRGSYGAVYEIQRNVMGNTETAALKVITIPQNNSDIQELRNDGYDNESITNTFKSHLQSIVNEYALMRKMKGCANIVDCDDVQIIQHEDGIGWDIYIKMERLIPLADTLPQDIPEEMVVNVAKDICKALTICKRFDIIHRDIKPQNIFVSEFGDYKLGDFGIAKTVEKTMGGTRIGTYKYMAPEVYNNQPYGSPADIYSLGLVLYWMLNERRMPFMPLPPEKLTTSSDEQSRLRRLTGEEIPAPVHGGKELQAIVLKACAFDQTKRYTAAAQMLADLQKLHVSEGVSAMPTGSGAASVAGVVSVIERAAEMEDSAVMKSPAYEATGFSIASDLGGRPPERRMEAPMPSESDRTMGAFADIAELAKKARQKAAERVQQNKKESSMDSFTAASDLAPFGK